MNTPDEVRLISDFQSEDKIYTAGTLATVEKDYSGGVSKIKFSDIETAFVHNDIFVRET